MRYWLETLGCPKNQVDSEKLAGTLEADGLDRATSPGAADVVVVNTCAFIEEARQESIDTILSLSAARAPGARMVVTGCLAERYGTELAEAMPEIDRVAGFGVPLLAPGRSRHEPGRPRDDTAGVPVAFGRKPPPAVPAVTPVAPVPTFDLLNLPRPATSAPWAYVKVAEGCDRRCGFCAIPSFRGRQRSRPLEDVVAEVTALARPGAGRRGVEEVVLVAQDLASYGRDDGGRRRIGALVEAVAARVTRTRLLYVYPSELSDGLIDVIAATGCPYFDLSLQHVSRPHLRRMRRWGAGDRFLERIGRIRRVAPDAALRSSFIVGYPGETEEDHDRLLQFLAEADLDWAGFFAFSREEGTYAAGLGDRVPSGLVAERLAECRDVQDAITAARRRDLVGRTIRVLVDRPGVARGHREAPEIDGVVRVPTGLAGGSWHDVTVTAAVGTDLEAAPPVPAEGTWGPGPPVRAAAGGGPVR